MTKNDTPKVAKHPKVRAIAGKVTAIAVRAAAFKIVSREGYKQAAILLKQGKAYEKELKSIRTGVRTALDRAKVDALAQFDVVLARLEVAERQLKDAMLEFDKRESALIAKEQSKLDRQANKKRDGLEARAVKARAAGKGDKAEELERQARDVISPTLAAAAPHVRGIAVRETYDFEVMDESKLPRPYLQPNFPKIRQTVQALGADANIAGVRVFPKVDIAAKSE
jgi:hypothetical protein